MTSPARNRRVSTGDMDPRYGRTFLINPGRRYVAKMVKPEGGETQNMNQTYMIDKLGPMSNLLSPQGTFLDRTIPIATSTPLATSPRAIKANSLTTEDMGGYMYNMWKKQKMCDMFIKADGVVFQLHKIVLAASSDLYSQKFADLKCTCNNTPEIELQGVSTDVVQIILNYLYTSDIPVDITNVSEFFLAAKQLGLSCLIDLCKSFLLKLTVNNVLLHRSIAESCEIIDVLTIVNDFIRQWFLEIVMTNEFKNIPIVALVHLFSDEHLKVNSELDIFSAAVLWIDHNRQERLHFAERVMSLVRFEHISPQDLVTTVESAKHIFQSSECNAMLYNAYRYHSLRYSDSTLVDSMDVPKHRGGSFVANEAKYDPRVSLLHQETPAKTPMFNRNGNYSTAYDSVSVHVPDTPNAFILNREKSTSSFPARQSLLLVSGGVNPYNTEADVPGRTIEQYNPKSNCWYYMTRMPDSRHHHGAVVHDNCLFIIGGSVMTDDPGDLANPTEVCYKYDTIRNIWAIITPLLGKRMYHAVATFAGSIVAIGGQDEQGQILDTAEIYDNIADVWTTIPSMTERKIGPTVIEFKDRLFVIGGFAESPKHQIALSTVECFDPKTNSWTRNNPLPIPCCHANVVKVNERLFLIGGSTLYDTVEPVTSLPSVFKYSEEGDSWEQVTELRIPRHDAGAAVIGSKIYIVGGANSFERRTLTEMECYDVDNNVWDENLDSLKNPCLGMACCTLPGDLVL